MFADAFCARCGVTPYCSERCQRRDWVDRHRSVCHNLARLSMPPTGDMAAEAAPTTPAPATPASVRRPRSPVPETDGNGSDKSTKRFVPPGHNKLNQRNRLPPRGGGVGNRLPRQQDLQDRQDKRNGRPPYRKPEDEDRGRAPYKKADEDEDWGVTGRSHLVTRRRPVREFQQRQVAESNEEMENWDAPKPAPLRKPITQQEPEKPIQTPIKTPPQKAPPTYSKPSNQNGEKVTPTNEKKPFNFATNEKKPLNSATNERAAKPQVAKEAEVKVPVTNQKPPVSVADVTPVKKLIPKSCVIETLSVGDSVLLSVENTASECRATSGFVCLSLHEKYSDDYQALCEEYGAACEKDNECFTPSPGETFSYFNPEDGGWYRARCVSSSQAALLDGAKIVSLADGKCVRLPAQYCSTPEFCCLLQADVQIGDSLTCNLSEKTAAGFKVSLSRTEGGAAGSGELARWVPLVQTAAPKQQAATAPPAAPATVPLSPAIPAVPRPDVLDNSKVLLVHVSETDPSYYVRPADKRALEQFDAALHDTALYGLTASPLKEPPVMGQYVVSKYTDGHHYRALVKRTNVKLNKYLLEYVEFGNVQVNTLENLYPCPEAVSVEKQPAVTSRVTLKLRKQQPLTADAQRYLDAIKDDNVELILHTASKEKSAPSGSEVLLTVAQMNESVNHKVEELTTPEWSKLEERGGDVLETEPVMYSSLEFVELPPAGELAVLDVSALAAGTLSACPRHHPRIHYILTTLTEQMGKYCESEIGRQPYLPKAEELCIAQLPPYPQWFRAVLAEQTEGPGGQEAEVCYVDYGNMERVPVSLLRKMLPEFVRDLPALANTLVIRDFPKDPSDDMLARAVKHLEINSEGQGVLRVTRCEKDGPGMYIVDAPELIAAMKGE